jgi:hypothetical protein
VALVFSTRRSLDRAKRGRRVCIAVAPASVFRLFFVTFVAFVAFV